MYIDTPEKLQKLCEAIKTADNICFDTEFMRERTFFPILCLIQLGVDGKQYAVDPLAGMDLTPLLEILTSDKLIILHSGRQDLEIIYNLTKKLPKNVFDTQIAAMVCGFGDQASYQQLVADILKKHVNKAERYTDWAARPLSSSQIEYALSDVEYLPELYKFLNDKIEKENRRLWLISEEESLVNAQYYAENFDDAWLKVKHREKKNCDLGVLQQVSKWREIKAREFDRPRRRIIGDDQLVEIALRPPKTEEALKKVRNLNISSSHIPSLLQAVEAGLAIAVEDKPRMKPRPKKTPDAGVVELLKILLKVKCEENKLAPKLLASTEDIEKFALGEDAPFLHGWRAEVFGKTAQNLVAGNISFKVENGKMKIT